MLKEIIFLVLLNFKAGTGNEILSTVVCTPPVLPCPKERAKLSKFLVGTRVAVYREELLYI